jgi:septal ring factor EnvC (AmiA/AmiB activator)
MTDRRDDIEIARLERRLKDAERERDEVRRRGAAHAPLLDRLEGELDQNRFAARLFAALKETRRHA